MAVKRTRPSPKRRAGGEIARQDRRDDDGDDDRQVVEEVADRLQRRRCRPPGKLPQALACDPCAQGCAAKNIDEIRWSISGSPLNTSASAIHSAISASSKTGSAHRPNEGAAAVAVALCCFAPLFVT